MERGPTTSELQDTWEKAAPGWAKWEHIFAQGFSQATDMLIDMASIRPGTSVLDIASGAGSQSIEAAKRVGPNGRVLATDISGTMLEHVRQNALHAGIENIETLTAAADELQSSLGPFDAAICRMGLMLFPAPQRALETLRPILRPGARFAALVFSTPANSPFLSQPMAILLRHAGKSFPEPGSPGIFALGGNGVLEKLLMDSGFVEIETKTVTADIVLPSAEDALHLMQEAAGAYRAVVANLDEEAKSRAWDEVYDCLKQFDTGDRFETRLEAIIGSGLNPE
jgi:ubiquinone/menaquinone biosynthesis C-methylase UbiE